MAGPWDDAMKKLVDASPQDFVTWLQPGAKFEKMLPQQLKGAHLFTDALLQVTENGKPALQQIEFQSSYDERIGERLLEYNTLATRENGYIPVSSSVVYLKDCGAVPQPPFVRRSNSGKEITRFHYDNIELHRMAADEMIQLGLTGLLPLITLTRDGARHEVVETMIEQMVAANKKNSLWIGYTIASKAMESDLLWLKRRFSVLGDFLRDTPIYQEVLEEGREEGLEKGREEGLEKGREEGLEKGREALRQTLVSLVGMRFPALVPLAKKQADGIKDTTMLQVAAVKMVSVQTAQEAEQYLLALGEDAKKN